MNILEIMINMIIIYQWILLYSGSRTTNHQIRKYESPGSSFLATLSTIIANERWMNCQYNIEKDKDRSRIIKYGVLLLNFVIFIFKRMNMKYWSFNLSSLFVCIFAMCQVEKSRVSHKTRVTKNFLIWLTSR